MAKIRSLEAIYKVKKFNSYKVGSAPLLTRLALSMYRRASIVSCYMMPALNKKVLLLCIEELVWV